MTDMRSTPPKHGRSTGIRIRSSPGRGRVRRHGGPAAEGAGREAGRWAIAAGWLARAGAAGWGAAACWGIAVGRASVGGAGWAVGWVWLGVGAGGGCCDGGGGAGAGGLGSSVVAEVGAVSGGGGAGSAAAASGGEFVLAWVGECGAWAVELVLGGVAGDGGGARTVLRVRRARSVRAWHVGWADQGRCLGGPCGGGGADDRAASVRTARCRVAAGGLHPASLRIGGLETGAPGNNPAGRRRCSLLLFVDTAAVRSDQIRVGA